MAKRRVIPNGPVEFRIDFIFVAVRGEDGKLGVISVPNPDRYEWSTDSEGQPILLDKIDFFAFPLAALIDLMQRARHMKLNYQPSQVTNTADYISGRASAINSMLSGDRMAIPKVEPPEERLRKFVGMSNRYAIVIIDISNRAQLQAKGGASYSALSATLAHELIRLSHLFHGGPLKIADGYLELFFAAPSFITKADLSLDYAVSAACLIEAIEHAAFKGADLSITWRMVLDGGTALADSLGHVDAGASIDLIGRSISMARQIVHHLPTGEIIVAPSLQRNLHTMWRLSLEPTEFRWPSELDESPLAGGPFLRLRRDQYLDRRA